MLKYRSLIHYGGRLWLFQFILNFTNLCISHVYYYLFLLAFMFLVD